MCSLALGEKDSSSVLALDISHCISPLMLTGTKSEDSVVGLVGGSQDRLQYIGYITEAILCRMYFL